MLLQGLPNPTPKPKPHPHPHPHPHPDPNPDPDPDPNLHQVLLQDRDAMNRAVEGDTVVLRLLPQSEWKLAAKRGEKLGDQAT